MQPAISPDKERITITIDKKLLKWLDQKVEDRIFANRSHGLEYIAQEYDKSQEAIK